MKEANQTEYYGKNKRYVQMDIPKDPIFYVRMAGKYHFIIVSHNKQVDMLLNKMYHYLCEIYQTFQNTYVFLQTAPNFSN